jgi:selT/selW/selH-like putative selenoprotein
VRLLKGARGAFEVRLDGSLIFSKLQEGRFPDTAEILSALQR